LPSQDRLTASDFSEIFLQNWREFFRWSNVDSVYLGIWRALLAFSRGLGVLVSWMEHWAVALTVVLAAALLAWIRWQTPGVEFSSGAAESLAAVPAVLLAACAVAAGALILIALSNAENRRLAPMMLLAGAATVAGLAVSDHWMRLSLLELATCATAILVWMTARTRTAKLSYLAVVLIAALCLIGGDLALESGQLDWARALLLTSICVKLAAVPLFFWLLALADEVPAVVLGLMIAVVDMAAFGELYLSAQASPWIFTPQRLLSGLAGASSLIAALLMLSQRSLKRLLVLSTVEDVGFLFLGLTAASALGASGALMAASTHALAKALLFGCLSAPEADGVLKDDATGLSNRYPVSTFGFLFGMLAMLGVPPTLGFIGRWRLYETALQLNPPLVAVFLFSSICALVAYTLALTRVWWGPEPESEPLPENLSIQEEPPRREPFLLQAVIVLLTVVLLAAGIWPDALQLLLGGRP
jgi:multicomponent Na+:H+ antiporter subunit D